MQLAFLEAAPPEEAQSSLSENERSHGDRGLANSQGQTVRRVTEAILNHPASVKPLDSCSPVNEIRRTAQLSPGSCKQVRAVFLSCEVLV